MKTMRIKNASANSIRCTGHRELKPGEERTLPEVDAQFFLATPKDENGKGVELVERTEPSKSEARRLAAQRGK